MSEGLNVIFDTREAGLWETWNKIGIDIPAQTQPLLMGDIEIQHNGTVAVLIERKTIPDLLSSIVDGRYKEQSLRLSESCEISNHNIVYLLEGKIPKDKASLVYSVMCSLSYFKGFSLLRTDNKEETCRVIEGYSRKIAKENRPSFSVTGSMTDVPYSSLIKKKKADNINVDNFLEIVLCQVPSVSSVTASVIASSYGSLPYLLTALQEDRASLDKVTLVDKSGKSRKISKTAVANIVKYLLHE